MYPTWIAGDGGPAIVLQSSAAEVWDGTRTSETEQTDYDAICELAEDNVRMLHRHDRDMLVLSDCSSSSTFVQLDNGEIAVLQNFSLGEEDPTPFVNELRRSEPDTKYDFQVDDSSLRLLVGADLGSGEVYDYDDCPVTPGHYQVWAYQQRSEGLVAIFVSV